MISKVFYVFLFLIVLLASLAFGGGNSQLVALDLVVFTLPEMPLFVITLGALAVGLILGALPGFIIVPYLRLKNNAMKNRVDMLEVSESE